MSINVIISDEVSNALDNNIPVVALESTIISHGMPYPQNVETALAVEKVVRENGAIPATIAIIGGVLKAGLSPEEIEYIGKNGANVAKVSRRDLPIIVANKLDGATTVATTMIIANMAGIKFFATGGIGGVHRGGETTMDISADLEELAQTPVTVVCAGAKSILDLPRTLEYLETKGVPVIGYKTDTLPAFYTNESEHKLRSRAESPAQVASFFKASLEMELGNGMLLTCPIPTEYAMPANVINAHIEEALKQAQKNGIQGKDVTPFLLAKIKDLTGGDSLKANIELVFNNAKIAALVAKEFSNLNR